MKQLISLIIAVISIQCFSQELKHRVVWYLPASNTQINGLGAGLVFSPLNTEKEDTTFTQVNGLALELIGFGILMPLFPKSPNFPVDTTRIQEILYDKIKTNYKINGIVISPGGHVCESTLNGINISGIGANTVLTNGISIATFQSHERINGLSISLGDDAVRHYGMHIAVWSEIYMLKGMQLGGLNYSDKAYGTQIGVYNEAQELRGLQLGILNKSKKMKGVQIGLWNINSKRMLPLINWDFSY